MLRTPVVLRDARVVVEDPVRLLEHVLELVPLEDVVVASGSSLGRYCGFTARPTAHVPPCMRSIQTTMRSSLPASSNPWSSRSAKRDAVDCLRMWPGYNRPDEQARGSFPQPVFVSVHDLEPGRPGRRVPDPRARARAVALRDPRRPLRQEPRHAQRDRPRARAARADPRSRRRRREARRARLDLRPHLLLARQLERGRPDRHVPRGQAVRLEDDDVVRRPAARELAGDDLLQLVYLEPVQDTALDGLGQVSRLELRLLDGVAADEDRPFEDDVVQFTGARAIRADRADKSSRRQPLAAEHGILRSRGRDDDVLLGRVAVALPGLGPELLAERGELLLGSAVGDDLFDPRQRLADARDLALRLPAAADHAERSRVRLGQVLRSHAAGRAGAQLPQLVRLDHPGELPLAEVEEDDDEPRPVRAPQVGLEPRETQLLVHRGHDRQAALARRRTRPGPVRDRCAAHPLEARFDRRQRICRRQELSDLGFGQVERQSTKPIAAPRRRPG